MSALTLNREAQSTGSTVLIFPSPLHGASETEAFTPPAATANEFFERLRAAFDAYVTESFVRQLQVDGSRVDSPFDAVYISALEPDEIQDAPRASFALHAGIVDLSDAIEFNDAWGD